MMQTSGDRPVAASAGIPAPAPAPFNQRKYLFAQKLFSINEVYSVYDQHGRPCLYVRRSGHWAKQALAVLAFLVVAGACFVFAIFISTLLRSDVAQGVVGIGGLVVAIGAGLAAAIWVMPKRHIEFYSDDSMAKLLLRVYQDKKVALITATYTAADAENALLGWYTKNYFSAIFRKKWMVYDAEGTAVCIGMEDSWWKATLRRLLGSLYGLLRTNFVLLDPVSFEEMGKFDRQFTILDKYVLELNERGMRQIDNRLLVALGVLLDTGERR